MSALCQSATAGDEVGQNKAIAVDEQQIIASTVSGGEIAHTRRPEADVVLPQMAQGNGEVAAWRLR